MSSEKKTDGRKKIKKFLLLIPAAFLCIFFIFAGEFYSIKKRTENPQTPQKLSTEEQEELVQLLDRYYPQRNALLKKADYTLPSFTDEVAAQSAVLADFKTGTILYSKNPDLLIPPASMTKLVEMYVILEETEKGNISLDSIVPLPPECWAVNMPRDASLMFLAEGQKVTLKELLLGLAVASGNDASIAAADFVAGNMDEFVYRMNSVIRKLGLKETHFVESSGYSEENITTAQEFTSFARVYLQKFPFSIKDFHSQKMIAYPQEKNLPDYQKDSSKSQPVVQYNTNKLLNELEGCDGLKTGFITESGYNLALTAERNGRRLISVTMGGPGKGSAEGNFYRIKDGKALMEYGFSNFYNYVQQEDHVYTVPVPASPVQEVNLIPAFKEEFVFPVSARENLTIEKNIPYLIEGSVIKGEAYGSIIYKSGGKLLKEVPLVSDRNAEEKGIFRKAAAFILARKSGKTSRQ
ncbi:MAG: D-alanyl-D-alanine carboxypeptidase [Treponema sp.]|nr:D-alanyl-D-alanine carboxypeptidase [Treponema sp.]